MQPLRLEIVYAHLLGWSCRRFEDAGMLARSREDHARRFTRRAPTLTFGDQKPSVDCVIWDISEGGARLAVALTMADLPRNFTLNLFRDENVQRDCEVVWMDRRYVGVTFTGFLP
jgi:hypothetical protein